MYKINLGASIRQHSQEKTLKSKEMNAEGVSTIASGLVEFEQRRFHNDLITMQTKTARRTLTTLTRCYKSTGAFFATMEASKDTQHQHVGRVPVMHKENPGSKKVVIETTM